MQLDITKNIGNGCFIPQQLRFQVEIEAEVEVEIMVEMRLKLN